MGQNVFECEYKSAGGIKCKMLADLDDKTLTTEYHCTLSQAENGWKEVSKLSDVDSGTALDIEV